MFLTRRYFKLRFQEAYINFDKKVGSGLIFLTVAFCLAFKNISLKLDGMLTTFCIKCHDEFKDMLETHFLPCEQLESSTYWLGPTLSIICYPYTPLICPLTVR